MKRPKVLLVGVVALCLLCGVAYGQPLSDLSLDFYVGWQGGERQTISSSSDGPFPGALYRSVVLKIPNRGVWLGAGVDAGIGDDLKLFVQGWYFLPSSTDGSILLDPGATPVLIPAGVKSKLDWWYIDVFGTYGLKSPFSFVLGLRIDHHNYYTEDPEILNIIFFPLPNQMRLDFNVLSTLPYFGFQWGPSSGLTVRAVYGPLGWINAKSTLSQNNDGFRPQNWLGGKDDFTKKEFFELFAEYSGEVAPSTKLAVFGKGTWLYGSTDADISESLVNGSAEYDVSYRRVSWTIGGRATVHFSVSDFLYPW